MGSEDWRGLAASHGRDEFARAFRHPFLLSLSGLVAPPPPPSTLRLSEDTQALDTLNTLLAERRRRITPADRAPAVMPVRKAQPTFPSMITVGRARNNDIVVPDACVSKLHAFFRCVDGVWTVSDAGSSNGTHVGDHALLPNGVSEPLRPGDEVRFGLQSFRFLDAAALWVALHEPR
jgi:hypothetical protein